MQDEPRKTVAQQDIENHNMKMFLTQERQRQELIDFKNESIARYNKLHEELNDALNK